MLHLRPVRPEMLPGCLLRAGLAELEELEDLEELVELAALDWTASLPQDIRSR
jgi:hypothetical protein